LDSENGLIYRFSGRIRDKINLMSARIFGLIPLISLPVFLPGQQSQIAGPVSGYVFDSSARGLRPILGIPGASLLGNPLDFGFEVASVSVAPRQDAAFVTGADGSFHLFRIQSGTPSEMTLNGMTGTPERVIFSPAGSAAALYAAGSIQVVSGLPDSPALAARLDLHALGIPNSLALSDDGAAVLASSGTLVELFGGAADLGKIADTGGSALVAFAAGGHDAAVADRAGAGLVLFRRLTGAMASQNVAPADDTIQAASALAFSGDGKLLLVANPAGQAVTTFDLVAGGRSDIACTCTPSTLTRMGDLFRLNEVGHDPLWLLDARPETAGVTFVPADAAAPVRRRPTPPVRAPRRGTEPLGGAAGAAAHADSF
jgi:hypothetical protein